MNDINETDDARYCRNTVHRTGYEAKLVGAILRTPDERGDGRLAPLAFPV